MARPVPLPLAPRYNTTVIMRRQVVSRYNRTGEIRAFPRSGRRLLSATMRRRASPKTFGAPSKFPLSVRARSLFRFARSFEARGLSRAGRLRPLALI